MSQRQSIEIHAVRACFAVVGPTIPHFSMLASRKGAVDQMGGSRPVHAHCRIRTAREIRPLRMAIGPDHDEKDDG